MTNHFCLFSSSFLSLLVVSSLFIPHAIVEGPLSSFVDCFTLVTRTWSTLSHDQKTEATKSRLLSSKDDRKIGEHMDGEKPNIEATTIETEANVIQNNTTTKGYRRIEEWHEETRDSKDVIQQLKQEKARWKKAFDNFEK